jgi:hypothetical protein
VSDINSFLVLGGKEGHIIVGLDDVDDTMGIYMCVGSIVDGSNEDPVLMDGA